MNDFVTDTHALYWFLTGNTKLTPKTRKIFKQALIKSYTIWIPSIVLAELYWLLEKQNKGEMFLDLFQKLEQSEQFSFIDFKAEDVLNFPQLSEIPEMHDRIIVQVAHAFNIPCITKDRKIVSSKIIETVW